MGWFFRDPLATGTMAPDFTLPDHSGTPVTLSEQRPSNVVLIFYPGDNTPVCRAQLCEFRDYWGEATRKNTLVFGINPGDELSHSSFRERNELPFPLLVDRGQKVCSLYRANGLIVKRTVYLIGTDGTIRYSKRGRPAADDVLEQAL